MFIDQDSMKALRCSKGRNHSRRVPAKLSPAPPNSAGGEGWTSGAINISPQRGVKPVTLPERTRSSPHRHRLLALDTSVTGLVPVKMIVAA
jgi:hypothetical protein